MRAVPSDPALPALRGLFPEAGAPEFVAEAVSLMTGVPARPGEATIRHVRYRPTKSCAVLWSFSTPDGSAALVSGTLFRNEAGADAISRESFQRLAAEAQAVRGTERPAFRYIAEQKLLLQAFPLDLRLPGLPLATSEARLRRTLPSAFGIAADARVTVAVQSYKPRHRCVLRYDIESDAGSARYFAKVFRDDRGGKLLGWLRSLHDQLDVAGGPWRITPPAAYVPEAQLLLFKAAKSGIELKERLKDAAADPELRRALRDDMTTAARGLAALQRCSIDGVPVVGPARALDALLELTDGLSAVAPDLAAAAERRIQELDDEAERLPTEALVLAHGAFRHDQLLLESGGQLVLDLDTICRSGASADAGNFLSYLDVTALRRRRLRAVADECASAFEQAAVRQPSISPAWTAWYRRVGHVKAALRSFLGLDGKWPELARTFLGVEQAALATRSPNGD